MRISDWSSDVCSSDLQQHRKGLPYRVVKSRLADFLQIDGVGLAQYVAALLGHLTRNTDGEAGAGERVPSDKGFRKAEFPAKLAHLVLEQFAQRLHQRHLHPLRQAADIVMALRSEEHTSELQSLMRISYAVFCSKKKK